jgi:hypothetical protein
MRMQPDAKPASKQARQEPLILPMLHSFETLTVDRYDGRFLFSFFLFLRDRL